MCVYVCVELCHFMCVCECACVCVCMCVCVYDVGRTPQNTDTWHLPALPFIVCQRQQVQWQFEPIPVHRPPGHMEQPPTPPPPPPPPRGRIQTSSRTSPVSSKKASTPSTQSSQRSLTP